MRKLHLAVALLLTAGMVALTATGCGEELSADWAKALDTAKQVRGLLVDGGDWTELAQEYSDDPGSKDSGGELGDVYRGQMVPEFEESVFSLKVDEISQPVKTDYGYHVIQVTAINEGRQQTFEEVRDEVVATILDETTEQTWEDWVAQAKSELGLAYTEDVRPSTEGQEVTVSADLPADTVAKVGGLYVTTQEFTRQVQQNSDQYGLSEETDPETYNEMRDWVLENLIQTKLALQKAPGLGVTVSDAEVQTEITAAIDDYFGGDQAVMEEQLASMDMTMEQFTQQVREMLVTQRVFDLLTGDIAEATDEEALAYYEQNKDTYRTEESRVTRHILITPEGDTQTTL